MIQKTDVQIRFMIIYCFQDIQNRLQFSWTFVTYHDFLSLLGSINTFIGERDVQEQILIPVGLPQLSDRRHHLWDGVVAEEEERILRAQFDLPADHHNELYDGYFFVNEVLFGGQVLASGGRRLLADDRDVVQVGVVDTLAFGTTLLEAVLGFVGELHGWKEGDLEEGRDDSEDRGP